MQIGKVIRKYRKEKNLTQEEMAKRLGVTAPAVNKWEKGASLPDISLLAPVARLLDITLETLLSFQEDLAEEEIGAMIKEIDRKFESEPYDKVFQYGSDLIHKYPNCHQLIWQIALVLDVRYITIHAADFQNTENSQIYQMQIEKWYLQALESSNVKVRRNAAGSLFQYYLRKEDYKKAEEYISFFPEESTDRKQKQALIYSKTNRREEAYRTYEEILFSEYQVINLVMNSLFMLSMEDQDHAQAGMWVEKESGLARLFDMGVYREECCKMELAVAEQDKEQTYSTVKNLLDSLDSLGSAFLDSNMYRHLKFSEMPPDFYQKLRKDLLENFRDKETFSYMKGYDAWEEILDANQKKCYAK